MRDEGRAAGLPEPVGILACGGPLPIELAAGALAQGRPVHVVAIEGFADPDVARFSHEYANLGQWGRILNGFRRNGCREIAIAGAMQRPNLWRLRIDLGFLLNLPTVLSLPRGGDDSVLRRVVRFFEGEGFRVIGVPDLAAHLIARAGPMGAIDASPEYQAAIARASALILALGPFDIGQGVVATADRVVAVEGVRGTDAMLSDLASEHSRGAGRGAVLVKRAKPGQEMRIDLPTIGPDTIARASAAGLAGIAVGAGEAVLIERAELVRRADAEGLFVVGDASREGGRSATEEDAFDAAALQPLRVEARIAPTPSDRRDMILGRRLMPLLRTHGAGRAAVIAGEHILAVSALQPVDRMVAALGRRSYWGQRAIRRRIGTLVIDLAAGDQTSHTSGLDLLSFDIFKAALDAGLAGICCLGGPLPEARREELIGWANDGRMFLMSEGAGA